MMSRGGRGYPRGGGSRGGSSYRGGGSYRGSDYSSSYNARDGSRNRYSGGGGGGSYTDSRSSRYDSNRYSRQDNRPDGGYKRNESYKQDSRDRRSPDRKRPRTENTTQGGRRDYSTGGGTGDYHRRDSSGGGRGGSSSRYHDSGSSSYDKRGNDHHSSTAGGGGGAGSRDRFDNRSSSRGRGMSSADRSREPMGPPRSVGPRSSIGQRSAPMRTSFGTRSMSSISTYRRGVTRGRINSNFRNDGRRGIITSRFNNRRDLRGAPPLRRRFTTIRHRDGGRVGTGKRIDTTTRVSRKALIKRALEAAKDLDDDHTTENEGDDDEEADDDDKDTTGADGSDCKKEPKEGEEDDGDKTEKEEEEDDDADKTTEKDEEEKEGDTKADESKDGEDADGEVKKEGSASPKKSVKKSKANAGEKSDDKSADKKDTKITTKYRTSSFIKLTCCHCHTNCVTFKDYHIHLSRGLHRAAMRRVSAKTRDKLMEMRQAQRVAQKEADLTVEDGSEQKSSYCVLCQLNFRQPKAVHQQSDGHKEMKRFLMPYCATCKVGFKSPMAYEAHRASLEHLKFKARVERYASKKEESGEDGVAELRLENFLTVDEVGNVDDPTDCGKEGTSTPKKSGVADAGRPGTDDDDDSDDVDEDTVIGSEHVTKVEVQYCDLCNMYLPRREDPEKVLRLHCKTRSHLRVYIRNREDKKLRERAERIHKKKLSDAKTKKDAKKDTASEADTSETADVKSEKKADEEGANKDTTTEDQMWEVVDNDLGDLLREVAEPAEDGEEEEDDEKTSSERYDKFRHTEKNGLDKTIHDEAVDEEDASSADKKIVVKKATNGDANCADKEIKAEA
ncbi:zinc finger protein on ecdysone puffs-like [Topomyia yanbarensis]|uniref:zinc finger protein on ecdysone puffs-like n=1 Tax=Topomyia yanbarensis TaxID=2498891 RepID=UPI00273C19EF|nr:zinc finger protein on ecdysone puffs-like [Topomyia yanbarensis]